jgi:hypothetical protein
LENLQKYMYIVSIKMILEEKYYTIWFGNIKVILIYAHLSDFLISIHKHERLRRSATREVA